MTICIGAICVEPDLKNKRVVLCADNKMGTWMAASELGLKFRWASEYWPALISGTISRAEELLATYKEYLGTVELNQLNVFDEMKKPAFAQKEKLADEYVRSKFGFSYEHLRKQGRKELPPALLYEAFTDIKNLDLGCSVLIAGFIDEVLPYIFLVNENGTVANHGHFGTIGTGGIVAESSLYQRGQAATNQMEETVYHVYEAKRLSEIAEGVGSQTSLMVIQHDDTKTHHLRARVLNEDGINKLEGIYKAQGFNKTIPKWDSKNAFRVLGS